MIKKMKMMDVEINQGSHTIMWVSTAIFEAAGGGMQIREMCKKVFPLDYPSVTTERFSDRHAIVLRVNPPLREALEDFDSALAQLL